MEIKKETCLALIVDNQLKLLPSITNAELLLHNTEILLQGLHLLNVPMIITQQYTKGLGMSHPSMFTASGLESYFDKRTFSCWKDESIRSHIISSQKKQIILCGVESHICILQTALDLIHNGYEIILAEDCVSSRKPNDKAIALQRMQKEGIVITTYESLLFELMETSLHPNFREISRLIK